MAFLDKKERIIEIILTEHGRQRLSENDFIPKYYAFSDDLIDYQTPIRTSGSTASDP